MIIKKFIITLFIFTSSVVMAGSNEFILKRGTLAILAPPVINNDYFLFEFGFVTEKKIDSWSYKYNAYVTASLFQDWVDRSDNLRAGGLGFKGGVFLPTQPWIPLLATVAVGYAKTVLHKSPFLGQDKDSVQKKDMLLIEAGLLYHYNQYFLRSIYQVSNVRYFKRHLIFMLGVDY